MTNIPGKLVVKVFGYELWHRSDKKKVKKEEADEDDNEVEADEGDIEFKILKVIIIKII